MDDDGEEAETPEQLAKRVHDTRQSIELLERSFGPKDHTLLAVKAKLKKLETRATTSDSASLKDTEEDLSKERQKLENFEKHVTKAQEGRDKQKQHVRALEIKAQGLRRRLGLDIKAVSECQ